MNKTGFFISLALLGGVFLLGSTLMASASGNGFLFAMAAPVIVFALEIAVLGWPQCSLRRILLSNDPSQRIDLLIFTIHITKTMWFFTVLFSLGGCYFLLQTGQFLIREWTGMSFHIDTGNVVLNFLIFYLMFSFLEYVAHRIFHTGPFWHLHKLHHSATTLNPLVMHRNHPANLFLDPLFRLTLPVALIPAPSPGMLTALYVANTFHQLLVHSSATWNWGWFGKWVLLSPAGHKIHHSINREHHNKNFSADLLIWDHLFGTWYAGDVPAREFGIEENDYGALNLVSHWFRDLRLCLTALLKQGLT